MVVMRIDDSGSKIPGNKRVFMITDNDEPPGSSSNREPSRTVYNVRSRFGTVGTCALMTQDLLAYGITINTFFIDKADHRFNPTIYWNVRSALSGQGAVDLCRRTS